MAKKLTIRVGGKNYPAFVVLGGLRYYEQLTGRNSLEVPTTATGSTDYLYCITAKACKREGVEFPYDNPDDFADDLDNRDLEAWFNALAEQTSGNDTPDKGTKKKA